MNALKIYEKAPAKINLMLDVLHKRSDGFHEVEMIMTMVDLADRLEMSELPRDTILSPVRQVIFRSMRRIWLSRQPDSLRIAITCRKGVHIHLDKKIPVAAGLAGGSSDAAATLRGLNRLWRLDIPDHELQELELNSARMCHSVSQEGLHLLQAEVRMLTPILIRRNAGLFWPSRRLMCLQPMCTDFASDKIVRHPSAAQMEQAIRNQVNLRSLWPDGQCA